jgi:hypothetical protein
VHPLFSAVKKDFKDYGTADGRRYTPRKPGTTSLGLTKWKVWTTWQSSLFPLSLLSLSVITWKRGSLMEEIDFERLEKIVTKLTDGFEKKLDAQSKYFQHELDLKLDAQSKDFWHELDLKLDVQSKDFRHELDLKLDVQSKDFRHELDLKLDVQSKDFRHELDLKLDAQSKDFHAWIGVQGEDFQHKLDLVVEGFQMLSEKIDRFGIKLDQVETGLDGVAASIAAHRMDTEAHHGLYRVKER